MKSFSHKVAQVYDQVAEKYAADRKNLGDPKHLEMFFSLLSPASHILDLGCGNGEPFVNDALTKGHKVTGVELSSRQLHLARKSFPQATFLHGDVAALQPKQFYVDAVVSLYVMFHLPRIYHGQLLQTFSTFLSPGGVLFLTMGDRAFEGWHPFFGKQVWASQYGPRMNRNLVEAAGFDILLDEIDRSGKERHQIIIGRKSSLA